MKLVCGIGVTMWMITAACLTQRTHWQTLVYDIGVDWVDDITVQLTVGRQKVLRGPRELLDLSRNQL